MGFLRRRPIYASAVVFVIILGGMLIQISSLPFFEPDESRYVEVSREMLETGEYVIPQLNYETRLNKPALYHWILASGFHFMGLSRFSARILSVLAAAGVLLLTARFAWKHLGREAEAPLSIAVLGTTALFWWMSRIAMVDIFLNLCVIAALFLLYDWERSRARKYLFWLAGLAVALGVNFKGPVAFALPAIIFFIYVAASGKLKSVWRGAPWIRWFFLILFLSLPWYVLATWKMGAEAGRYFFIDELFARFLTNKFHRERPLHLFLLMVPLVIFPWSILAVRAIWNQRIIYRSQGFRYWVKSSPARAYLLIWSAGTVIFFSLCKSKMVHYLIPLTPALALLTADWLNLWSLKRKRILTRLVPFLLIGLIGVSLLWLQFNFEPSQTGIPLLIVCGLVGIAYTVYISTVRFSGSLAHLFVFILIPVLFYQFIIISFNRDRDIWPTNDDFAQFVKEWAAPETKIFSLYKPKPSMLSQIRHRIDTIADKESISRMLDSPRPSLLLSTKSSLNAFVQSDLKNRSTEIWANYVPFEKYGILFNRAYADAYLPSAQSIALEQKGDVRLIAVGDPGGHGREPFEMERLLERIDRTPDAVLLLGDNVFLHPTRKYDRIDTVFESPFKPFLEKSVPFYAVLGNEDQEIADRIIKYPKFHMEGKRYYSKTFGDGLVECFFSRLRGS